MKNSIFTFSLLIASFLLCSFQKADLQLQEILQKSLDVPELADFFAKDENGQLLPVTLVSNQLVSQHIDLRFAGKDVVIKDNKEQLKVASESLLELKAVKIKSKKSILEFAYQEKTIRIRLKKEATNWHPFSILIKGKGTFQFTTTSYERTEF